MKNYNNILKFLKDNNIKLGKLYTFKDMPAFKTPQQIKEEQDSENKTDDTLS